MQHVALADALPQAHEECMHHLVPAGDLALLLLEAVAYLEEHGRRVGQELEEASQVAGDWADHLGRVLGACSDLLGLCIDQDLLRLPPELLEGNLVERHRDASLHQGQQLRLRAS